MATRARILKHRKCDGDSEAKTLLVEADLPEEVEHAQPGRLVVQGSLIGLAAAAAAKRMRTRGDDRLLDGTFA